MARLFRSPPSASACIARIAIQELTTTPAMSNAENAIVAVLPLTGQTSSPAKKESSRATTKAWTMPRTPDGHPDLQGIWTNTTLTPLERPAELEGKLNITDAEATAYERRRIET